MNLELATVLSCNPGGCRVQPVTGGAAFDTRYSALVLNRVRILPGQLVAVDLDTETPEVAWRWYRVQIVELGQDHVIVQERERRLSARLIGGLAGDNQVGDEVWVTGMDAGWELHDHVSDGKPAHGSWLNDNILPRIDRLLSGGGRS